MRRAEESGMNDYLIKPVEPQKMISVPEHHIALPKI